MQSNTFLQEALAMDGELRQWRRWLHAHPGVGFRVEEAAAYVKEQLAAMGIAPQSCGKNGVTALLGKKETGRVFLLRADMDSLAMQEESGEPFAAANGNMHACGHDTHTAMLLGAAKLLKRHENELCGRVKLLFQPAEETLEGAKSMVEHGVLEDPPVSAAAMVHSMVNIPLPPGTVVVPPAGGVAPAADYFEIQVLGKGCHGSAPHQGVDAITAAAHILTALQELHARELPLGERAVLTVGTFRGGDADNAIAHRATLGGTLRAFDENTRAFLKQRMEEMSGQVAGAFRAKAAVIFTGGCPVLQNDPALVRQTGVYLQELLGENCRTAAESMSSSAGGSEDFAYIARQVPAIMLALAAGAPADGFSHPLHHPKVKFDERALPQGAAALAWLALRWLEENR